MTYLEAVNNVLRRLREATVASVSNTTYSALIGVMVNDAKTQVENSYAWNALQSDLSVTTVASTSQYALTGSGQGFRVLEVLNDTNDTSISLMPLAELKKLQRTSPMEGTPKYYSFNGTDANGDTLLELYPTPDAAYSVVVVAVVPQAELASDATALKVPSLPVVLGAYARAVAERGEDQGFNSSEIYGLYKDALSDAIAIESSRTADDAAWGSV